MRRLLSSLATAAVLALAPALATAQLCSGPNQIFLKNDNLPDVPGTATVSVIPGLCEGEAMGCVFNVVGQQFSNEVRVNSVSGAYINVANTSGIAAIVNLKIYDGITWVGTTPVLGPEVFDFETAAGANIQFNSSGINTVDLSNFDVRVSSGKLIVGWFMELNTAPGSCASGYQTNFATDNTQNACAGSCSPVQKNLIFIQGQGWRDPMTATVSGFPLCSCFYAGNWIIRACVEPVGFPRTYCTGKLNSANCVPAMGWTGVPTLTSGADDFHIRATNVINNRSGLFFWGTAPNAGPFLGGTLCVAQPVVRTGVQSSGGSPTGINCNTGAYDYHFTQAYAAQAGIQLGTDYYGQYWMRDPQNLDGTGAALSNGINFRFVQ
jgi:hypothetical protein